MNHPHSQDFDHRGYFIAVVLLFLDSLFSISHLELTHTPISLPPYLSLPISLSLSLPISLSLCLSLSLSLSQAKDEEKARRQAEDRETLIKINEDLKKGKEEELNKKAKMLVEWKRTVEVTISRSLFRL